MASIFTLSNISDFNNNLTHANKETFRSQINSNPSIGPNCTEIKINVDAIELWFDAPMSNDEEIVLRSLIQSKYKDTYIFDAIVDARGNGDYTRVADAFAAGKTSVYVRDGVYIETANVVIPDGGQLVGESQSNVKIVLVAGNSVVVDGSGGLKVNTGTVSIDHNSNRVVGTGTSFTNLLSSSFILLGTNFYQIQSVETDELLTLKEIYQGKTLSNIFCFAQQMFTGVKISNIIIANSASTGLFIRGVRHCGFRGVAVLNCNPNIKVEDSGDSSLCEFICGFSRATGLTVDNSHSMLFHTLDIYNSVSHGIELRSKSSSNVFDSCSSSNNAGMGFYVSGNSFDINIVDTVIKHNNHKGLYTDIGSNQIIINGCSVIENLLTGIHLCGSFGVISNNVINSNGSHGLDGGRNCSINGNQICKNDGDGIYYDNSDSVIISTNRLHDNKGSGIRTVSQNCAISNNVICNCHTGILFGGIKSTIMSNVLTMNVHHGLELSATASKNIIGQNQFCSNNEKGIFFNAGSNNNLANFNILTDNTITDELDLGTGNDLIGNKIC